MGDLVQDEANQRLRRARIVAGQRIVGELAPTLTFVRGVDTWSMQAQAILPQRTHVLVRDRLACGRTPPHGYTRVDGPDEGHQLCDTCAQAYGTRAPGFTSAKN